MTFNILYEDNHLLMVEKPVNIPVQADNSKDKDLLTMAKDYIKVNENKPGAVYLALVHRLDRPVGGVMVFAKTSKAASRLSDQIRRKTWKKTYLAVSQGKIGETTGTLRNYLYKDKEENMSYVVDKGYRNSKFAELDYQVLDTQEGLSLVLVHLDTGRSHQIRVQLAHAGLPIYGDQRYNSQAQVGQQIALWSHGLEIEHPTLKEPVKGLSYPPSEDPWYLFDIESLVRNKA